MQDIAFIIDKSSTAERISEVVEFLVSYVRQFQTGSKLARFAVMTFSETNVTELVYLDKYIYLYFF